jgi:uncharacterized protein YeaO (DUF488 family)
MAEGELDPTSISRPGRTTNNRKEHAMIRIKHLMDAVRIDDGIRIWVEPIGLTKDLCRWCHVEYLVPQIAPPIDLWEWFTQHPEGYDDFRGQYHLALEPLRPALEEFVSAAATQNFTLLHQGGDPQQNTAARFMTSSARSALTPRRRCKRLRLRKWGAAWSRKSLSPWTGVKLQTQRSMPLSHWRCGRTRVSRCFMFSICDARAMQPPFRSPPAAH